MKLGNVIDPKLLGMGLGVAGATFVSAQLVDTLDDQQGFVGEYAREIAGAALTVVGSLLMGQRNTRTVGLAVGATGVSTVASGLVRRMTGKTASLPAVSGGGGGGTSINLYGQPQTNWFGQSTTPVTGSSAGTSHNVLGRGIFTLAG